ncbi:MAG TPA: phosphoribosylamine--glycine ligase [Firmicutes bacterium]|nr:phosphoribosylamine--glycine ligase [Bacillota bacterium]
MRVLVIGGGGREHALVWKLAQSPEVQEIFCAPGNAGIASLASCVPIGVDEHEKLLDFARQKDVQLTVVGPEAPLLAGLSDLFRENGLLVFGPSRKGALLEGSKSWAKDFMVRYNIPTGVYKVFTSKDEALDYLKESSYPQVVKADGLAAGKGVIITGDFGEASLAVERIMEKKEFGKSAGEKIVIEEFLEGEEVSVFAVTDGFSYEVFPSAQDHKAAFEGDRGPNTGGMGAYSPPPVLTDELEKEIKEKIFEAVISGFQEEGIVYRGVIFGGLILTSEGIKVLEFNARFGDPETQVILPRLKSDLFPILFEAARGGLSSLAQPSWHDDAAVCVVMASGGYPGKYEGNKVISGLDKVEGAEKAIVFHAGTTLQGDQIVTSGGRVLNLTAWDLSLEDAVKRAYDLAGPIRFDGARYRKDIAHRAFHRK